MQSYAVEENAPEYQILTRKKGETKWRKLVKGVSLEYANEFKDFSIVTWPNEEILIIHNSAPKP